MACCNTIGPGLIEKYLDHIAQLNYSKTSIKTKKYVLYSLAKRKSIQAFLNRGVGPATRNKELQIIDSFFSYLVKNGHCSSNPVQEIEKSRVPKRIPKTIGMSILLEGLEGIKGDDFASIRDLAVIECGLSIASRISDFLETTIDDLDLEHKRLRVFGKGQKEYWQPLGSKAIEALQRYLPVREELTKSKALFINQHGMPLRSFYYIFTKRFPNIKPHELTRHTMAVMCLGNNMKLHELQAFMRHENLKTTSVYLSVLNDEVAESHAKHHPRG